MASLPLRLQSLWKMLILGGSKWRLALIWTTGRDLEEKGGQLGWGGPRAPAVTWGTGREQMGVETQNHHWRVRQCVGMAGREGPSC